MATRRRCCVPGCSWDIHSGDSLHRFPNPISDRVRFNTWLYAIGGDVINFETSVIFKYCRVCRRHFEEKYHCRNTRLSNIAIPTLQMPDFRSPQYFAGSKPIQAVKNIESKTSKLTDNKTSQDDNTETHVLFEFHDVQEMEPVETGESPDHNLEETISEPLKIDESPEDNLVQTAGHENEESPDFPRKLNTESRSELGDASKERPISIENIHRGLLPRWNPILKKGLPKDVKDKLMAEYLIPDNCQLLMAPTLNPEIQAAISERIANCDKNYQAKQNQLGVGISAINQAISLLLCGEDKMQAVKVLSDSCRILTDLHYIETQARKKKITPYLDECFRSFRDNDRDEMLFGKEFSEKIKASMGTEKRIKLHTKNKDSIKGQLSCGTERSLTSYRGAGKGGRRLSTRGENQGSNQVGNQDVNDAGS